MSVMTDMKEVIARLTALLSAAPQKEQTLATLVRQYAIQHRTSLPFRHYGHDSPFDLILSFARMSDLRIRNTADGQQIVYLASGGPPVEDQLPTCGRPPDFNTQRSTSPGSSTTTGMTTMFVRPSGYSTTNGPLNIRPCRMPSPVSSSGGQLKQSTAAVRITRPSYPPVQPKGSSSTGSTASLIQLKEYCRSHAISEPLVTFKATKKNDMFVCTVTVSERRFGSLSAFPSRSQAEAAAAENAMRSLASQPPSPATSPDSLSPCDSGLGDSPATIDESTLVELRTLIESNTGGYVTQYVEELFQNKHGYTLPCGWLEALRNRYKDIDEIPVQASLARQAAGSVTITIVSVKRTSEQFEQWVMEKANLRKSNKQATASTSKRGVAFNDTPQTRVFLTDPSERRQADPEVKKTSEPNFFLDGLFDTAKLLKNTELPGFTMPEMKNDIPSATSALTAMVTTLSSSETLDFHIKFTDPAITNDHCVMQAEMQVMYSRGPPALRSEDIEKFGLYAVESEGTWLRGYITGFAHPPESAHDSGIDDGSSPTMGNPMVYFIDHGDIEQVNVSNMRLLMKTFAKLPQQTVLAVLADLEPIKDSRVIYQVVEYFWTLVGGAKPVKVYPVGDQYDSPVRIKMWVHPTPDSSEWVDVCELIGQEVDRLKSGSQSPAELLADQMAHLSASISTNPEACATGKLKASIIPMTTLPAAGEDIDIIVCYAESPHDFWVQPASVQRNLLKLNAELSAFCASRTEIEYMPCVGDYVSLCVDQTAWIRALVLSLSGQHASVLCVDYGETRFKCSIDSLQLLPSHFAALPACAISCRLFAVDPSDNKAWTKEESRLFANLVVAAHADGTRKIFRARVHGVGIQQVCESLSLTMPHLMFGTLVELNNGMPTMDVVRQFKERTANAKLG